MPILIVEESDSPSALGQVVSFVADAKRVSSETHLGAMLAEARVSDVFVSEFAADEAAILRMCVLARAVTHVLVLSSKTDAAAVGRYLSAGAHECIPLPCDVAELGARIRAARLGEAPTSTRSVARSLLAPIVETRTWRRADVLAASALSSMLGAPLQLARARDAVTCRFGATLTLAAPDAGLELGVGLALPDPTASCMAMQMVGETDETLLRDLAAELANVTAGVFKNELVAEGQTIALRVPKVQTPREFTSAWHSFDDRRFFTGALEGHPFTVAVGVRWRGTCVVHGRELREDMVLAEDLRKGEMLLVARGTRLTSSMAERASRHAPTAIVRVCAA